MPPNSPIENNLYPNLNIAPSRAIFWKNKYVRLIIIVLGIFFISIVIFTVISRDNSPRKIGINFLNSIQSNDSTKSYAMTSVEFKKLTALNIWIQDVKTINDGCMGKIKILSIIQKQNSAQEKFIIESSSGTECNILLSLVNSSNKWQIFSINYYL